MRRSTLLITLFVLVCGLIGGGGLAGPAVAARPRATERPLPQAHAHNDYEHDRPLLDALDHGFTSVEADVWLIDGELRVAHDEVDTQSGVTLDSLYLQPLAERARVNHGRIFPRYREPIQLLIDIKTDGPSTYAAIDEALRAHPRLMTSFRKGHTRERAVTAVISGNRPLEIMQQQEMRFAGYDGRLPDLESGLPASLMPLVSDNWTHHFTWAGEGDFPAEERERLHEIVDTAHGQGYRFRFWSTPDTAGPARDALWRELRDAGVDHINTDDLQGLEDFLRRPNN